MCDEDYYDEEAEAMNDLSCPRCGYPLKIIGRSGFCENDECILYEVLFKDKHFKPK